jgi:hypothetical protein
MYILCQRYVSCLRIEKIRRCDIYVCVRIYMYVLFQLYLSCLRMEKILKYQCVLYVRMYVATEKQK